MLGIAMLVKLLVDYRMIFFHKNSLNICNKSLINFGLFYNGRLSLVISFKRLKCDSYEIIGLCSLQNTIICGGISKLLNYFISIYDPSEIISYSDNSIFSGKTYEKLGFNLKYRTDVNSKFIHNKKRENKLFNNKIKIWDCGYNLWIYKLN